MKKILRKIDRFILDALTKYVRRWIKKNNFEKHKVDLIIKIMKMRTFLIFLLAMLIPAMTYIAEGRFWSGGFHMAIWSISVFMGLISIHRMEIKDKPEHDILFSLRKNPQVYQMEKEILEFVFKKMIKIRMATVLFDFGISWVFSGAIFLSFTIDPHFNALPFLSLALYFVISPILTTIQQYLFFVFDFDEPEEKKKVVKESLTEIVLRAWENLIGGLAPQPNYG